jgi:hypothetical protein
MNLGAENVTASTFSLTIEANEQVVLFPREFHPAGFRRSVI